MPVFKPIIDFLRRLNTRSLLAFAGMAGPVVLVICDFTAAFTSPGYNLIRDSISSLALTKLGWLPIIGFLAIGLLVEIFTAGLLFNVKGIRGFHLSIGIFVFFGFSMLLIGAFRTDPAGASSTAEGMIHGFAAKTAFTIFPVAILIMGPSLKSDPNWRSIFKYTIIAGILAVLLIVLLVILDDHINWFGLLERILVANMIIWVEVAAVNLVVISLKHKKQIQSNDTGREIELKPV